MPGCRSPHMTHMRLIDLALAGRAGGRMVGGRMGGGLWPAVLHLGAPVEI